MPRGRRRVVAGRNNQFTATKSLERGLNGAFGKAGGVREDSQTCGDRFPFVARGLSVEMEINEVCGRLLIVADEVAHEHVEDIIIDWDDFFKTRQDVDLATIPVNGQQ